MSADSPSCPLCGGTTGQLFRLCRSPLLQNVLYDSRDAALTSIHGDFSFHHCASCHHGFNPGFRSSQVAYDSSYDNDQSSSATYRDHVEWVVGHLIDRCALGSHSRVLEVGCGNGYLLSRIEARCGAEVSGFDPAYQGRYGDPAKIRCEYFHPTGEDTFDLAILRHCIDGLTDPASVIGTIASALPPTGHLYVESADLDYILRGADFSLLFHEYARYFSKTSLALFLGQHGFTLNCAESAFGGQYYACLFRPSVGPSAIAEAPARIIKALEGAQKVLIWGVSGRAITILSHLALGEDKVAHAVDIAEAKQGRFLPVTGQRILSPDEAVAFGPDLVIIPNRNYESEIRPHFDPATRFLLLEDMTP